jgi:hypothetical protein
MMDSNIIILLIILAAVIIVAIEIFVRLRSKLGNSRPKKLNDPENLAPSIQPPLPNPRQNKLVIEKDITFIHTNEKI